MDPSTLCKAFFALGTAVDLGGTLIPPFRQKIMNYGSRGTPSQPPAAPALKSQAKQNRLFDYIAGIQVPHTWFTHYYVVSVSSSLFWAFQTYTRGRIFQYLASNLVSMGQGMSVDQVFLAWGFMAVQGSRRLYESLRYMKPSHSRMWSGLWLIGIAYYVFMGIAVWIEGIGSLQHRAITDVRLSAPSIKTLVAVPLFVLSSGIQHICHKHLASLKKYTLPTHWFFRAMVCPHYTSECLIYVAIAIVSAPQGKFLNRTVLAGLGFVITNLGVTADSTRKWYVDKFGVEALRGRWRMLPYVY